MPKEIILTQEGHDNIELELKELKDVKRPEIIERIRRAKEFGDLSENAEYQTAKEDQSFMEGRILELELTLKHAVIAAKSQHGAMINLGNEVTVDLNGKSQMFKIVGATESDPNKGKISSESPVGSALLGHKVNDTFSIQTPGGEVKIKVTSVK